MKSRWYLAIVRLYTVSYIPGQAFQCERPGSVAGPAARTSNHGKQKAGPVNCIRSFADVTHLESTPDPFVRRAKAPIFSRCNSCPATFAPAGSNRSGGGGNETAGASDGKDRVGDSASTQAVTCSERRAGLETANVGADPAKGWGRPPSQQQGSEVPGCGPTGVMATACVHREIGRNTGSPSGGPSDQPDAREGQAGPCGVADRPAVPSKPGNAGGGKGPDFRSAAEAVRVRRMAMLPRTSVSRLGHRGSGLGRRRRRGRRAGPCAAA